MSNWTPADVDAIMRKRAKTAPQDEPTLKRGSKHHNVKTEAHGIVFDSGREARRYSELRILEDAGEIYDLELQPPYQIMAFGLGGHPVYCGMYHADFKYVNAKTNKHVIEDAKGESAKTEAYQLRKKLVEACHGIKIVEV